MPEWITGAELDGSYREELRALSKDTAERVSRHLVAALISVEEDPADAAAHAKFAVSIGARVGIVRETYGVIAYQTGDYHTAVRELRTAMRITGRADILPMLADAERGVGRPERALDIAASPEAEKLGLESTIELMIVVAGAYADTGDVETALTSLEIPALRQKVEGRWQVRLWVAYADLLERAGRSEEARKWLLLAADADTERITDAAERLGRPAPVEEPNPTWYDAEEMHVVDAFDEDAEDDEVEGDEDDDETEVAEVVEDDEDDTEAEVVEGDEDDNEPEAELDGEDIAAEADEADSRPEHLASEAVSSEDAPVDDADTDPEHVAADEDSVAAEPAMPSSQAEPEARETLEDAEAEAGEASGDRDVPEETDQEARA
ncbi:hypothetical protein BF93_08080 [Brachybacterium phenoliresistens]|uniref:Replicase polyprotein 1ab n=1 Tax=Brachybacterium phenoliresistens TaxID=396014 RepID=Z9JXR3_9MICO|nr:hypothetical protein BF93_08080 [Brachybacterium phenoliresistens]